MGQKSISASYVSFPDKKFVMKKCIIETRKKIYIRRKEVLLYCEVIACGGGRGGGCCVTHITYSCCLNGIPKD